VRQSSPNELFFTDELGLQFHYGIRVCRILKGCLPIHAQSLWYQSLSNSQGPPTDSRTEPMISEPVEFSRATYRFTHQAQRVLLGVTAESRTKAQRVLVVTGV